MFTFIDSFFQFVTDSKKKISHRFAAALSVIFFLLLLDNTLGFVFHYKTNNQINDLEKVDKILNNPTADAISKAYASKLKTKIVSRQSLGDYLFSFISSINLKTANTKNPTDKARPSESAIKKSFNFFLSTSGGLIGAGITTVLLILFGPPDGLNIFERIGVSFLFLTAFTLTAVGFNVALRAVPLINGQYEYNFLLNLLVQGGLCVLLFLFYKRSRDLKLKDLDSKIAALDKERQQLDKERDEIFEISGLGHS